MKLSTGSGVRIVDPTPEQIRDVLAALPAEGDNFAIYERDNMTYIQVAGSANTGFLAEYQIGSTTRHFRATNTAIGILEVVRLFESFARDDDTLACMEEWELDEDSGVVDDVLGAKRGCLGGAGAMLGALVALAVVVALIATVGS